eukprot:RCo005838
MSKRAQSASSLRGPSISILPAVSEDGSSTTQRRPSRPATAFSAGLGSGSFDTRRSSVRSGGAPLSSSFCHGDPKLLPRRMTSVTIADSPVYTTADVGGATPAAVVGRPSSAALAKLQTDGFTFHSDAPNFEVQRAVALLNTLKHQYRCNPNKTVTCPPVESGHKRRWAAVPGGRKNPPPSRLPSADPSRRLTIVGPGDVLSPDRSASGSFYAAATSRKPARRAADEESNSDDDGGNGPGGDSTLATYTEELTRAGLSDDPMGQRFAEFYTNTDLFKDLEDDGCPDSDTDGEEGHEEEQQAEGEDGDDQAVPRAEGDPGRPKKEVSLAVMEKKLAGRKLDTLLRMLKSTANPMEKVKVEKGRVKRKATLGEEEKQKQRRGNEMEALLQQNEAVVKLLHSSQRRLQQST